MVLTCMTISHHRPAAVIDLGFFPCGGHDHSTDIGWGRSAQAVEKPPHALIAISEAVLADQVLPDSHGIAALDSSSFNHFSERLTCADTARFLRLGLAQVRAKVGDHLVAGFAGR